MKQKFTFLIAGLICFLYAGEVYSQGGVPEILYYKFDGIGTTVPNEASAPPAGTLTGTIMGAQSQGSNGLCGGALIGSGASSTTDYLSTGWNTNLGTGAWTIAFWTDNIPSSGTLFYHFGDASASSFRCFTNGVAGAGNFWLRGPMTDVPCDGCAPINTPSMTAFVYDPVLGNIKAYHDGVLVNTVAQPALNITGTDFKVGGYSGSTGLAAGELMDEFRFYDRPLDATEIFDTYMACLPLFMAPDDAGVASIDSPVDYCPGTLDVMATIKNFGSNIIDSCIVQWEIDAVPQTPYYFYGTLDTAGGAGLQTAQITLGSSTFASGTLYNITAWTELPNGVADTVNTNDTTSIFTQSSLSGSFTIGGAAPDYLDFSSAVSDLVSFGLCGPVVFDVRSGTYYEQINLAAINGSSATNTVVFRSEAAHRDSVILTFGSTLSTANYTTKFSGADYVSFKQITMQATGATYGHVMEYSGASDNNSVWDCHLWGTPSFTTSTNMAVIYAPSGSNDNYNTFSGNLIEGGSYGNYWWGSGSSSLEVGTVFENNTYISQYYYGSQLYYQDAPKFTNNTFKTNSAYTGSMYGFYFNYCDNEMKVTGNSASVGLNNYGYGMYFSNCTGAVSESALIANNMLSVGNPTTTSTSYGFYFSNTGRTKLYNNSVLVESNGTSSRGIYVTSGGAFEIANNSFMVDGPGYAAYYNTPFAIAASDYNNYYTNSGANFMWWSGSNYSDLASYQAVSGLDANAVNVDPNYYAFGNLHVCNDSLGGNAMAVPEVTVDIDGAPRNASTPDIGADEFTPLVGSFLGADSTVCTGDTLWLWAGAPSDVIVWSTGDSTNSIMVTTPGTYWVDVVGSCGSGADTIDIAASALVYSGFIDADTTLFCTPGSATLSSTQTASSYTWSTAETTPTITVTTSGTYDLTISDGCGSGTESIVITAVTAPTAGFTGFNTFLTYSFTNTTTGGGTTTYAWDFGDTGTSSDVNPIHVYSINGMYFVTLTATNECGTHVYSDSVMVTLVGIDEMENGGSLAVYPNPNNGSFILDLEIPDNASVNLYVTNELGQKVYAQDLGLVNGNKQEGIDLGDVQSGIYFVIVNVDDQQFHYKMIVK